MKRIILSIICIIGVIISNGSANYQGSLESVDENMISEEICAVMGSAPISYTYSIGGINNEGHDFTPNVNYSYNIFGLMDSVGTAYMNTTPSYSYISGNNPSGYKKLGSKIVLLTGHANAHLITLDNNYGSTKIGVCDADSYTYSGRQNYGLNNVSMTNTDLIMFFGCNTASGTSNLCSKSINKGASAAVGTTHEVVSRSGEGATWVQRFIDGLYNGKTVLQAGLYANSFVSSTCSMRTGWTCYGTSSTTVNPSGSKSSEIDSVGSVSASACLDPAIIEEVINLDIKLDNRDIVADDAIKYESELRDLLEYLKGQNIIIDLADYKLSVRTLEDGISIISLDYFIGKNISTNKGINFVYENGVISTMTYNKDYYANVNKLIDVSNIEKIVSEDMTINPQDPSVVQDQKTVSYYTYDFSSGSVYYIEERYIFDGEVWVDSYKQRTIK